MYKRQVKDAYLATMELIGRAEAAIADRQRGRVRFGGVAVEPPPAAERRRVALAAAPYLRGLVSRDRRAIVAFDDAPDVLEFAASREAAALCTVGPATPDHTIYTKRLPCFSSRIARRPGRARRRSTTSREIRKPGRR